MPSMRRSRPNRLDRPKTRRPAGDRRPFDSRAGRRSAQPRHGAPADARRTAGARTRQELAARSALGAPPVSGTRAPKRWPAQCMDAACTSWPANAAGWAPPRSLVDRDASSMVAARVAEAIGAVRARLGGCLGAVLTLPASMHTSRTSTRTARGRNGSSDRNAAARSEAGRTAAAARSAEPLAWARGRTAGEGRTAGGRALSLPRRRRTNRSEPAPGSARCAWPRGIRQARARRARGRCRTA
jgi:hypothetical protein